MTQNAEILTYLLRHKDITPLDALATFGCMRLGARIWDLRHRYGVHIQRETKTVKTRNGTADVASYSLLDKQSALKALEVMKETA